MPWSWQKWDKVAVAVLTAAAVWEQWEGDEGERGKEKGVNVAWMRMVMHQSEPKKVAQGGSLIGMGWGREKGKKWEQKNGGQEEYKAMGRGALQSCVHQASPMLRLALCQLEAQMLFFSNSRTVSMTIC